MANGNEFTEDVERAKRTPNYGPINDFSSINRTKDGISMESLSVFHDHYNYPDISGSFFNDISVNMNDLSNDNSFDNIIDCDPLPHITDEIHHSFVICRLCAKTYSSSDHLKDISTEPDIYEALNTILPNQVSSFNTVSKHVHLRLPSGCNIREWTSKENVFSGEFTGRSNVPTDVECIESTGSINTVAVANWK